VGNGFVHRFFFGVLLEKGADEVRINFLDGDDEVGGEEFGGIDQEERPIVVFIFDPKGDDVVEAVQDAIDTNATLRNFYMRNIGRRARKERECDGCEDDEKAKKYVVQNNRGYRDRDSDDTERPKPISTTLDVFVFVCAPAEGGCGHTPILPRPGLQAEGRTGINSLPGYFDLEACADGCGNALHKVECRIPHTGFKSSNGGLGRACSLGNLRLRNTLLDARIEYGANEVILWLLRLVHLTKCRISHHFHFYVAPCVVLIAFFVAVVFHREKYSIYAINRNTRRAFFWQEQDLADAMRLAVF